MSTETKPSNPNPKDIIGSNKVPLSLVPGTTKAYLALGHLEGDLKYGRVNWREAGIRVSIYLDALDRHVEKFKNGQWEDPETGVPHLANALSCLSIIVDAYECGKLIDDRPKSAPVAETIDRLSASVKRLRETYAKASPVDHYIGGPVKRGEPIQPKPRIKAELKQSDEYRLLDTYPAVETCPVCDLPINVPGYWQGLLLLRGLTPDDRYMD